MRIGAHVFTPGGWLAGIDKALEVEAEALQLFASNPRAWAGRVVPVETGRAFRERLSAEGLGPAFVHVTYLVNVASPNPEFWSKSVAAAIGDLEAAEALGASGLVVHSGSGGAKTDPAHALGLAVRAFTEIADQATTAEVLIELTAGTAGSVAATIGEAARLFDALGGHPRIALCLDTCHLFAAGYALDEPGGVRACFDELRSTGLDAKLRLVHANDAAFPRGSRRDRHANVGTGGIGERGFAAILADPALGGASVLVETPGRREDHLRDVRTLKRLARDAAA